MILLHSAAIQWEKNWVWDTHCVSTFLRLSWQEVFFKIFTYIYFMNSEALPLKSSDCWHVIQSNKMYAKKINCGALTFCGILFQNIYIKKGCFQHMKSWKWGNRSCNSLLKIWNTIYALKPLGFIWNRKIYLNINWLL